MNVIELLLEIALGIFACSLLLVAWKFRDLSLSAEETGDIRQEKIYRRVSNVLLVPCVVVLLIIL